MKTIEDFKRRLVVGARVKVTNLRADHRGQIPPVSERVISHVQSAKFVTKHPDGRDIWCDIPKSKDFRVDGPNIATLLDSDLGGEGVPYVTIEFL